MSESEIIAQLELIQKSHVLAACFSLSTITYLLYDTREFISNIQIDVFPAD